MSGSVFNYDVTGPSTGGSFTVTTTAANGNNQYAATAISGNWGGRPITGLVPLGGFAGNDNVLGFGNGFSDGLDLSGISFTTTDAGGQVEYVNVFFNGANIQVETAVGTTGNVKSNGNASMHGFSTTACFLTGTRIETTQGPVVVEALEAGMQAVLANGATSEILWVGSRRIDCATCSNRAEALPVRIRAGAFTDGLPRRDLYLSPEHAVFRCDVLVPVRALIDGDAIAQIDAGMIEYFHVQLARHDVILAEGLPVESYLQTDSHGAFHNGADAPTSLAFLHPCAPMITQGPILEQVRAQVGSIEALQPAQAD